MTKCESVIVSIGYKIKISEIIEKLNENTFEICKLFFKYGRIEDEKFTLNNTYFFLLQNNKNTDWESYKNYFLKHFMNKNSLNKALCDYYLLIPIYELVEMTRKGIENFGVNTKSISLNDVRKVINPEVNKDVMKTFDHEMVMITELSNS